MAAGQRVMGAFDAIPYRQITQVEATSAGRLTVHFRDGDVATLVGQKLLRSGETGVRWTEAHIEPVGGDGILIPREGGEDVAIPWDVIRINTDYAYAAYCARRAEEAAQDLGRKVRALREARGMTAKRLATCVGITPQSMYRIEHGRHRVELGTLARILGAMGCTWADMVTQDQDVRVSPGSGG